WLPCRTKACATTIADPDPAFLVPPVPALHAAHAGQLLYHFRDAATPLPDAGAVLRAIAAAGHRVRRACIRIHDAGDSRELGAAVVPHPDRAGTLPPVLPLDASGRGQLPAQADGAAEARRAFSVTTVP